MVFNDIHFVQVSNMNRFSIFVSCLIPMKYWAKLDSLIGQNLIIEFYSFVGWVVGNIFDDTSSNYPRSRKIAVFHLFHFAWQKLLPEILCHSNKLCINILTIIVFLDSLNAHFYCPWKQGAFMLFAFPKNNCLVALNRLRV